MEVHHRWDVCIVERLLSMLAFAFSLHRHFRLRRGPANPTRDAALCISTGSFKHKELILDHFLCAGHFLPSLLSPPFQRLRSYVGVVLDSCHTTSQVHPPVRPAGPHPPHLQAIAPGQAHWSSLPLPPCLSLLTSVLKMAAGATVCVKR